MGVGFTDLDAIETSLKTVLLWGLLVIMWIAATAIVVSAFILHWLLGVIVLWGALFAAVGLHLSLYREIQQTPEL